MARRAVAFTHLQEEMCGGFSQHRIEQRRANSPAPETRVDRQIEDFLLRRHGLATVENGPEYDKARHLAVHLSDRAIVDQKVRRPPMRSRERDGLNALQ